MPDRMILKGRFSVIGLPLGILIFAFAAALFLSGTASGQTAEQKAQVPQKVTAPRSPESIPMAEVATRATEVSNFLRHVNTLLGPDPPIDAIQRFLPVTSRDIELDFSVTKKFLQDEPTLSVLQAGQQIWEKRQLEMTHWLSLVTHRATQLQAALNQLAELEKVWSQTLDAAKASKAPEPILQQIEATIAAVRAAQTPVQTQISAVLDLQGRVAQEVTRCGTALAGIGQEQQKAVGELLKRENPPMWSTELWARARTDVPSRVRGIAVKLWEGIQRYFQDLSGGLPSQAGLFILLMMLFCGIRRQARRWTGAGEGSSTAITAFDRPFSAALVVALFVATSPYSQTPPAMRELFTILELVPLIRLTKPVVHPRFASGFYALGALFALNIAREAFAGARLIDQFAIMIEAVAGMAALGWALTGGILRRSDGDTKSFKRVAGIRAVASLALLMLTVSLVAGVTGYLRLARLLVTLVLGGGSLVLLLFAYLRVIAGLIAFALRVWPLRLLQMVQRHCNLLERRAYRILVWVAVVGWINRVLDYIGLLEPTLSLGKSILAARLERGTISISVEDVLAFIVTVWVSYLLSRFLRFVLQEDVYPRTRIAIGSSYAISSLLHYLILSLGVVVGLGLLGMDLTKVTVLAGAFGVGIGFGLQSVVNNFVSGLILLFERPVHVGDTVEVGNLQGRVERIGIRSSIVRTGQGAEIIVPNSQLISDKVTNWTLSDQRRRIDVPVGVNYGANPQELIELMVAVAQAHPGVLKDPAPQAFFTGYGENAINFELRAWTDQFGKAGRIRSDLSVALHKAIQDAGMTFPAP